MRTKGSKKKEKSRKRIKDLTPKAVRGGVVKGGETWAGIYKTQKPDGGLGGTSRGGGEIKVWK